MAYVRQHPKRAWKEMTERERKKCRSVISGVLAENGIVATAKRMNCTNQNVYRWLKKGWMPAERAFDFSQTFHVKLGDLRPDLWGRNW